MVELYEEEVYGEEFVNLWGYRVGLAETKEEIHE